jgi:hypothetical protein
MRIFEMADILADRAHAARAGMRPAPLLGRIYQNRRTMRQFDPIVSTIFDQTAAALLNESA